MRNGFPLLLELGARPNHRYHMMGGATPLHFAAERGNVAGVDALLDHGADVEIVDGSQRTPLQTAARNFASRWGRHGYHANAVMVARILIENGSDASELHEFGWRGRPLHAAALLSDGSAVADLIIRGHDPNSGTPSGWTALHIAALVDEQGDVVETLLEGGADPNARFGNGRTPLHCAAFASGNPRVIATLVAGGADPNARTTIGWTPLHSVVYGNANPEIVRALLGRRCRSQSGSCRRLGG